MIVGRYTYDVDKLYEELSRLSMVLMIITISDLEVPEKRESERTDHIVELDGICKISS